MFMMRITTLTTSNVLGLLLLLLGTGLAQQQQEQEQELQPSRVPFCDARYSTPCGRKNSRWLAKTTANELLKRLRQMMDGNGNDDINGHDHTSLADAMFQLFNRVTDKEYNVESNFYPFIIDKRSSVIVAHGGNETLVGDTLRDAFVKVKVDFTNVTDVLQRFYNAADNTDDGGDYVEYLWYDNGQPTSKVAFVTNFTDSYVLGVGYEENQLPPDGQCNADYSSWCSINNVRSLLGKAEFLLNSVDSIKDFDKAKYDLSYNPEFTIDGGYYIFAYSFEKGDLVSHGVQHDKFGTTLQNIVQQLGLGTNDTYGTELHQKFIDAAEGKNDGFVSYLWRNSKEEEPYTKIAYITKVEINGVAYYVGTGYTFQRNEDVTGPNGEDCTVKSNLPCAFRIALDLASYTFSYAISSNQTAEEIFDDISYNDQFKVGNGIKDDLFYPFFFRNKDTMENVAHGRDPEDNVGLTLDDIIPFGVVGVDGKELHKIFVSASKATNGGRFVAYDWFVYNPETDSYDLYEKLSYIFPLQLNGQEFYGGVGFRNQRHDVEISSGVYSRKLRKNKNTRVSCSRRYGLDCSEINSRAILGYNLANLTLASNGNEENENNDNDNSNGRVNHENHRSNLDDVLTKITDRVDDNAYVNDFFVRVFSFDGLECPKPDNSGCCIADGSSNKETSYVNKTWNDIVDMEGIDTVKGWNIHSWLKGNATDVIGVAEFPYSSDGQVAQSKKAWVSLFQDEQGRRFYIVTDYLLNEPKLGLNDPDFVRNVIVASVFVFIIIGAVIFAYLRPNLLLARPKHWRGKDKLVEMEETDKDYKEVKEDFLNKLGGERRRIILTKIERVQNLSLWRWYSVKLWTMEKHKKKIERQKQNIPLLWQKWNDMKSWTMRTVTKKNETDNDHRQEEGIERKLFHGTKKENAEMICSRGFKPMLAGKGKYGIGTYFARDSKYSIKEKYSQPDENGIQQMFRCRVVIGDYCVGRRGMKQPDPMNDDGDGIGELYDSAVNRLKNPTIFVVFNDMVSYPEYLISFRQVASKENRRRQPVVVPPATRGTSAGSLTDDIHPRLLVDARTAHDDDDSDTDGYSPSTTCQMKVFFSRAGVDK